MKFGKQLLKASEASTQLCAVDQWLDYKGLKKLLGSFQKNEKNGVADAERPNETIQSSPFERRFFKLLHYELNKVTKQFCLIRARLLEQVSQLKTQQKQMLYLFKALHDSVSKQEEMKQLLGVQLKLNVETHLDLILLESYAVLNYIGFRKILKKHDKFTGYRTQEKYMLKLVDGKPFTSHAWIGQCLRLLEAQFEDLRRCKESHEENISRSSPRRMCTTSVVTHTNDYTECTDNFVQLDDAASGQTKRFVDLDTEEREKYLRAFKQHAQEFNNKQLYIASHSKKRKKDGDNSEPEKKQRAGLESKTNLSSKSNQNKTAKLALESLAVAAEIASRINETENEKLESQSE